MAILSLLKNLLMRQKRCGADAIKFQTFLSNDLVLKKTKKVHYQKLHDKNNTMFKKC